MKIDYENTNPNIKYHIKDVLRDVVVNGDEYLRAQFGDSVEEWQQMYLGKEHVYDSAFYDLADILENHGIECGVNTLYGYFVDIGAIEDDPDYPRYREIDNFAWLARYTDTSGKRVVVHFFVNSNNSNDAEKYMNASLPADAKNPFLIGRVHLYDDVLWNTEAI